MRKKREQITMDFPKELRQRVKVQAAKHRMMMKEWLIYAVTVVINKEIEVENEVNKDTISCIDYGDNKCTHSGKPPRSN